MYDQALFPFSLEHKPVANRRTRPAWAKSDKNLFLYVLGENAVRRLRIAYLYWRQNWSAKTIAEKLRISIRTVETVIYRLKYVKTT